MSNSTFAVLPTFTHTHTHTHTVTNTSSVKRRKTETVHQVYRPLDGREKTHAGRVRALLLRLIMTALTWEKRWERQTDRETSNMARCVRFAVARIGLRVGEILHIFPLAPKVWETGDPKRLTRVRGQVYTVPADQIWL